MIMQDKLEKERNDAKNYVEEYVYEMRGKLHGVLENFVSEAVSVYMYLLSFIKIAMLLSDGFIKQRLSMQDRDSFSLKLEDTENWLYEEGEDQQKQVYIDKLAELKVDEMCYWFVEILNCCPIKRMKKWKTKIVCF